MPMMREPTNIILQGRSEDHGDWLDGYLRERGQSINCVVADPPYGVDFVSRRAETADGKKFVKAVADDLTLRDAIDAFDKVMDVILPRCAVEAELYVFTRWDIVGAWIYAVNRLARHGFKYKMLLVWDKGIPGMGDIDANWGCGHELILYCKRGRRDVAYRRSGIIAVDKLGPKQHVHPTEKPVPLIERLIEMSTASGDLVLDPYSGSGSTSVAAKRLGRDSIGIELDPQYVAVAQKRLTENYLF